MIEVNDIIRVALHYTGSNASEVLNVFWYQLTIDSLANASLMDILEDYLTDVWGDAWADFAAQSFSMDFFEVDIINPDGTVNRNIGERTLDIDGTVVGDGLPAVVSGYMYASTAVPKARGSKYVPGIAELNTSNGVLSAGAVADLSLMLIGYLATLTTGGSALIVPGVLSRPLEAFVPFTAQGLVNDIPAYQRRRKPNVGS